MANFVRLNLAIPDLIRLLTARGNKLEVDCYQNSEINLIVLRNTANFFHFNLSKSDSKIQKNDKNSKNKQGQEMQASAAACPLLIVGPEMPVLLLPQQNLMTVLGNSEQELKFEVVAERLQDLKTSRKRSCLKIPVSKNS